MTESLKHLLFGLWEKKNKLSELKHDRVWKHWTRDGQVSSVYPQVTLLLDKILSRFYIAIPFYNIVLVCNCKVLVSGEKGRNFMETSMEWGKSKILSKSCVSGCAGALLVHEKQHQGSFSCRTFRLKNNNLGFFPQPNKIVKD